MTDPADSSPSEPVWRVPKNPLPAALARRSDEVPAMTDCKPNC
jgi:hypothetical protein